MNGRSGVLDAVAGANVVARSATTIAIFRISTRSSKAAEDLIHSPRKNQNRCIDVKLIEWHHLFNYVSSPCFQLTLFNSNPRHLINGSVFRARSGAGTGESS